MTEVIPPTRHEKTLRGMKCMVSGRLPVTLHHCHGGSMLAFGPVFPNPGGGQRNNPFFQIPLHALYHVGAKGIDTSMGVKTWEERFYKQTELLVELNNELPYNIFEQARLWQTKNRKSLT